MAVHATIPFVAMTRQGIGMPKTVIFLTIGSAILGQAFGARLEQQRLLLLRQHQERVEAEEAQKQAEQHQRQLREDRQAAAARRQQMPFPCALWEAVQERSPSMPRLQNHILSLAHDFGHNVAAVGA